MKFLLKHSTHPKSPWQTRVMSQLSNSSCPFSILFHFISLYRISTLCFYCIYIYFVIKLPLISHIIWALFVTLLYWHTHSLSWKLTQRSCFYSSNWDQEANLSILICFPRQKSQKTFCFFVFDGYLTYFCWEIFFDVTLH